MPRSACIRPPRPASTSGCWPQRRSPARSPRREDIGSPEVRGRYERRHRLATLPLYLATNGIVELYTNDAPPMRAAREILIRVADRAAPFKALLANALTRGARA